MDEKKSSGRPIRGQPGPFARGRLPDAGLDRSEVDDAVQEAWLRLSRSDAAAVDNLGGWLTTVVARVCLDMLRSRKSRREEPMGPHVPEPIADDDPCDARPSWPTSSARHCWWCWKRWRRPNGWPSCCTTCSPCRSRRSRRSSSARPPRHGSLPAAPGAACRAPRRRMRDLSRQRAIVEAFLDGFARAAISRGCSRCSIPTSCPAPTKPRSGSARWRKSAAPPRWRKPSRAARRRHAQRLSMARLGVAVVLGGRLRVALRLTFTGDRIAGMEAIADADQLVALDMEML